MRKNFLFHHIKTISLLHQGECDLVAVSPDLRIYVDEIYGVDDQLVRHVLTLAGEFLQSADEALRPPPESRLPDGARHSTALNYSGPRLRGIRQTEHIQALARPLSIQAKMQLAERLKLDVLPPLIYGVAESYVLSEAALAPEGLYLVCRRIRIAHALPTVHYDADNQPYDYDTATIHIAHRYDPDEHDDEIAVDEALAGLPGVALNRPMDCIAYGGYLVIGDSGGEDVNSRVHIWRIAEA